VEFVAGPPVVLLGMKFRSEASRLRFEGRAIEIRHDVEYAGMPMNSFSAFAIRMEFVVSHGFVAKLWEAVTQACASQLRMNGAR
jgi:hypothetical protein